jgi:hypothetical protein
VTYYLYNSCASFLVNNTPDTEVVYDHWDFGGTTEWLKGRCIIEQRTSVGMCVFADAFGSDAGTSVYVSFVPPFFLPTGETQPGLLC